MQYGQIVEWVNKRNGVPYWHTGKVLDVIPAGDALSERPYMKHFRTLGAHDISIYDRVLVEVNERHGRRRYYAPRLAKIRAV